jgi:retron-type reverse transcriptase
MLGVPTVVDRLIQQALHQVLQPLFEPTFSDSSFGFRPGMMSEGLVEPRTEGTPQGGPLSPLLSNILLNDLDRELERRQLAFCRYADDCNIYVRSRVAGDRVMSGVRTFLEDALKLRVNPEESAVARPWERKFLAMVMVRGGMQERPICT